MVCYRLDGGCMVYMWPTDGAVAPVTPKCVDPNERELRDSGIVGAKAQAALQAYPPHQQVDLRRTVA